LFTTEKIYVTDALAILLNFYEYQTALGLANYLDPITDVSFRLLIYLKAFICHKGAATNGFIVSDATVSVRGSR
jgi:hypothetical protein